MSSPPKIRLIAYPTITLLILSNLIFPTHTSETSGVAASQSIPGRKLNLGHLTNSNLTGISVAASDPDSDSEYKESLQPCGDGSVKRLTYLEEDSTGAIPSNQNFLCGIVNGYDCPPFGRGEDACAGLSTCKPYDNSKGKLVHACHCNPRYPARVDEICQHRLHKTPLFFTLMVQPYLSGYNEEAYLEKLKYLSSFLEPFETRFTYAEPTENITCPVRFTTLIDNAAAYYGNLEYIVDSDWATHAGTLETVAKDLKSTDGQLCDYTYPVHCVDTDQDGQGDHCTLITNDVFVSSDFVNDDTVSALRNVKIWILEYGVGSVCNHPSSMNPDLPKIYNFTVKYTKCTGDGICTKTDEKYPEMDGSDTEENSYVHKCACPEGKSGPQCQDDGGGGGGGDTSTNKPWDSDCSKDLNKTVKTLNEDRLKKSTLNIGDPCNFKEVQNLQDLLSLEKAAPGILPKGNLDKICEDLNMLSYNGSGVYCNPRELLYCGKERKCTCMGGYAQSLNHMGDSECFLKDDLLCGKSWVLTEFNEMQGLPKVSPDCESELCVKSAGDAYRCKEDYRGLLMVHVKDLPNYSGCGVSTFSAILYFISMIINYIIIT